MKKIIVLLSSFFLVFTISACTKNKSDEARDLITSYFSFIQDGNYTDAMYLCAEDVDDRLGLKDLNSVLNQDLNIDNDTIFKEKASEWIMYTVSQTIKDYEIVEQKEKNNQIEVIVIGKSLDFNDFNSKMTLNLQDEMDRYMKNNKKKLENIVLKADNETDAYDQINEELYKFIFDEMKKIVDQSDTIDFAMRFTLENVDNKLTITNIEDTVLTQ